MVKLNDPDSLEPARKRRKLSENNHKDIKMKKCQNIYINIIDIPMGKKVAKIEPFKVEGEKSTR